MDLFDRLFSRAICYDNDGGPGGGQTISLEERTNQKLSGGGEEPAGGGGESGEEPKGVSEEPSGGEPEGGGEEPSGEEPAGRPEPSGGEEPAGGAEPEGGGEEGEESGEEAGGGGESDFYYDPEVHVDGEPAHTNKFKTREKAEMAAIHKASMMKEALEEGAEEGIDRGAIPLPKALNGSEEALEDMTNLEIVHSMDDDELRNFLNESDGFRQKYKAKAERKKAEQQRRQTKSRFEEAQVELYDAVKQFIDPDDLEKNVNKLGSVDEGMEYLDARIDQKVSEELAEDKQALSDWIDKVDSGKIDMSFKEFDEEKQAKVDAINRKAREIREKYEPAKEKFKELHELDSQLESSKELTPAEKKKNMWNSFDEFQGDRAGDLAMLEDDTDARAELVSFKNWAAREASRFNDLQHPADWNDAVEGWEEFKAEIRSGRQRKELGADDGQGKSGDDIPKPGDQSKLDGERSKGGGDVAERNRKRLDKLEEMTNAAIGV